MIFAGVFLAAWLPYKCLSYFPKVSAMIAAQSFSKIADNSDNNGLLLSSQAAQKFFIKNKLSRLYITKIIDKDFYTLPVEQGFVYLNHKIGKSIAIGFVILVVIALPLMILDILNYKVITKDGIIERKYASLQITNKSWSDVAKVETGCYYFTDNNNKLVLKYEIKFYDGSSVDLFAAEAKGDKINQIRLVDNVLRQLGTPFSIMIFLRKHKDLPYVNEACFQELRKKYPSQYSEIIRLLRLEKYSTGQKT